MTETSNNNRTCAAIATQAVCPYHLDFIALEEIG